MYKQHRSHSARQLCTALKELVESWWCVDRIRASPREGRLLRLFPGSAVTIHGTTLEIVQRVVRETPRGPLVCYETCSDEGTCQLWIAAESPEIVMWIRGSSEQSLSAGEIDAW